MFGAIMNRLKLLNEINKILKGDSIDVNLINVLKDLGIVIVSKNEYRLSSLGLRLYEALTRLQELLSKRRLSEATPLH